MGNMKLKNIAFNKLIEKACKGTIVSTKELHRDLYNSGYHDLYDLDLELEDLKMIVSDIADSKEISSLHTHASGTKPLNETNL